MPFIKNLSIFAKKTPSVVPKSYSVWAWGSNLGGKLGVGNDVDRSSPVQIGALSSWTQIASDGYHTLGLRSNGTIWGWGWNFYGELDNNTTSFDPQPSPVQIGAVNTWTSVAAGWYLSGGVRSTNTLWMWGRGSSGGIGNNSTLNRSAITQVTGTTWSKIAIGESHVMAIKSDGTLWSWGANNLGQLGLGNTTNRSSPVQIGSDTNWSSISCGSSYSFAIKTNGTLWAWGSNDFGQLGLGNTTNISSPVQIGSDTNWSKICDMGSFSYQNTLAIKTTGTLWAWGNNQFGQLGLGDTTNRSSPVQIGSDTNWSDGAMSDAHAIAVKSTGTLWSWGLNDAGQLGLGDTTNRSSPVQIGSLTKWEKVFCGYKNSFALYNHA
jgi:alpha-tubulin suppressor-like RCC1 family protein